MKEDLSVLTNDDLQHILNVIRTANSHLSVPEMRAKVARSLKQVFRAEGVAFFLGDREFGTIDNASLVGVGMNRRYLDRWVRHYSHHDPFQQEGPSKSTVCKVDDILPYKRWVNLKIYNEFYRPQNIHYKLSISLRSSARILGLIGMFRPKEHQDFSERDVVKARILAPHLATALEHIIQLPQNEGTRNPFGGCSSEFPLFGAIVLDHELRPIYWNSEAKEICLAFGRAQRSWLKDLTVEDPAIPSEILDDCLELKGLFENGQRPSYLRRQRVIDAGQYKRFQVTSSLVEHSSREVSHPRFMVHLLDLSEFYKVRQESPGEEYRLTKREVDIVRCVCQGLTNDEIGERLYISRFTVETHLKNIFDKTGVKHRAGLASLLQSL